MVGSGACPWGPEAVSGDRRGAGGVDRGDTVGKQGEGEDSTFHVKPANKDLTIRGRAANMWSLNARGTT